MEEHKEERTDLAAFSGKVMELRKEIGKVIVGQQEAVDLLLTAIHDRLPEWLSTCC